jgi:hypothetical protein
MCPHDSFISSFISFKQIGHSFGSISILVSLEEELEEDDEGDDDDEEDEADDDDGGGDVEDTDSSDSAFSLATKAILSFNNVSMNVLAPSLGVCIRLPICT